MYTFFVITLYLCAFLKANKLLKRLSFHHGQGSWIVSFGKDCINIWVPEFHHVEVTVYPI
jgi:hypothetical protein